MLRRAFAVLLLILTVSPFTAPFATCDVATLVGGAPIVPQQTTIASAVEDGSHTVPLCAASTVIPSRIRAVARAASDVGARAVGAAPVPHGLGVDAIASGRSHATALLPLRI